MVQCKSNGQQIRERETCVQVESGEGGHPHTIKSVAFVTDTMQVKLTEFSKYWPKPSYIKNPHAAQIVKREEPGILATPLIWRAKGRSKAESWDRH